MISIRLNMAFFFLFLLFISRPILLCLRHFFCRLFIFYSRRANKNMQTLWKKFMTKKWKEKKGKEQKKVEIGSRHPRSNFVRSHRRCCFVCSTWNYLGKDLCIEARTCARTLQSTLKSGTTRHTPKPNHRNRSCIVDFVASLFLLLLLCSPSIWHRRHMKLR